MRFILVLLVFVFLSSCKRSTQMILLVSDRTQLKVNLQNKFEVQPEWDKDLNIKVDVLDSSAFSSFKNEKQILLMTFPNDSTYTISSWVVENGIRRRTGNMGGFKRVNLKNEENFKGIITKAYGKAFGLK